IEYIYDNKRLLFEQIKIQIGTKSIIHYDYKYDLLERIIEIRKNNIIKYHYEYDLNGNINRTNEYESIHYNKWDQIVYIKQNILINYIYDNNGFMIKSNNGNNIFIFNSNGLLIKYKKNNNDKKILIQFIYDYKNRLIGKFYTITGRYIQYIYDDYFHSNRIKHIYDSNKR
ncbi:unnamed protein product, partial [Didymodactylos carnosus]